MLPEKKAKHQPAKNPLIYNKGDLGGRKRKSWPALLHEKNQFLILKDVFVFEIILRDD